MKIPAVSARQWKFFLCAALIIFGIICIGAIANWQKVMVHGVAAELPFTTGNLNGHVAQIQKIEPGTPLADMGVKVGDRIRFDERSDGWRALYQAGEPIGLTIGEGSARRHVTIRAQALPHIDPALVVFYVLVVVNALVALALAALIGLRRAASPSARLLALVVLIEASFARQFMAGGVFMDFNVIVLAPIVACVAYCGFFLFTCWFPNDDTSHVPGWVRMAAVPVMLCYVAYNVLGGYVRYGGELPFPMQDAVLPVLVVLILVLSGVNLWHAYRRSAGEVRQRMQWVGIAVGVRFLSQVLNTIPGLPFIGTVGFGEAQIILIVAANLALAYAILKHRVFDVGFAVNRALVFTIVSVVLLVAFGLMEWLAHHFVSPEEAEKNAFLDAGIALGLYLVFHRLRHFVDHAVDRLFFHKWHVNEERLRRFVRHAVHITSPQVLIDSYLAALQRFTGEAGCALYRQGGAGYELVAAAGLQAPPAAGIDDPLAVALRAELAAAAPADCDSGLPGVLALPMSFRGELQGFVVLGQKPSQDAYRPDEIAVLEHAAHQVGLDLQALRTEQLQLEVAALRRELESKIAFTRVA